MRRHIEFACGSETLIGTLDCTASDGGASATRGLLILSGGNEIRSGGHRGMAQLARTIATDDIAVFRFDRRGTGDSSGDNAGFMGSDADLEAALNAFRTACPALVHITGLGLCDAAAALLLHPSAKSLDQLILLNPWTLETAAQAADNDADTPAPPSAVAIRARYIAKLKNPREIWRLLSGGVNLGKLWRGMRHASISAAPSGADGLPAKMRRYLRELSTPTRILIAQHDTTAMAFLAHWNSRDWADVRGNHAIQVVARNTASHSFASPGDAVWLAEQVRCVMDEQLSS